MFIACFLVAMMLGMALFGFMVIFLHVALLPAFIISWVAALLLAIIFIISVTRGGNS